MSGAAGEALPAAAAGCGRWADVDVISAAMVGSDGLGLAMAPYAMEQGPTVR